MTANDTSPLFLYMIDRGGALGERTLEGAIRRAEERALNVVVTTTAPGHADALLDPNLRGVAGTLFNEAVVRRLRRARYPAINFSNQSGPVAGVGNFLCDDRAVGRLAAEYLARIGYRHFLGIGPEGLAYSRERMEAFRDELRAAGREVRVFFHDFPSRQGRRSALDTVAQFDALLRPVLSELPLDCAIFCANDWLAGIVQRVLVWHFQEREHTTAVLGVDDEQRNWWYLGPHAGLSSVRPAFHAMGAAALDWLVEHAGDGAACRGLLRRFPPERVAERASTAGGVCADPMTARMMRWAWTEIRAGRRVRVSDLAAKHRMSRRTAERFFERHAGRSAGDYLQWLRLDLAKHLLRTTRLSVGEISERCGFAKQDVLSNLFRKSLGMTPREFRAAGAAGEDGGAADF